MASLLLAVLNMANDKRPLPLDGIRVLDLTRVLSGPYATLTLADLGAEIIKVEEPTIGDVTRDWGPHLAGESHYFLALNRSKKSITLDLKSDADRATCKALVKECDVVIENFRPGVMDRLGLSYAEIARINPRIVMCSISGFGTSHAEATSAFDITMQALTGLMSVNGDANGPPMRLGIPIADLASGLFAVIGITAALRDREVTNRGRHVDVAMYKCMVSLLSYLSGYYFTTGESPARTGNAHLTVGPLGVYTTADGQIVLSIMTSRFWQLFCEAIGRQELLSDPRFLQGSDRAKNREELSAILNDVLSKHSTEHWEKLLLHIGIPHARIRNIGEVLEDPMTAEIGMVQQIEHDRCGTLRVLGSALRFVGSDPRPPSPPPTLGEHTQHVLSDVLGISKTKSPKRN